MKQLSSLLFKVGCVLIVTYIIIVASGLIPYSPRNPLWQLNLIANLVDNAGIPLIGTAFVFVAAYLSPKDSLFQDRLQRFAGLSMAASVGFLLLMPLQMLASIKSYESAKSDQIDRIARGTRRLLNLSEAINQAANPKELQAELQKFDGMSLSPEDLAKPLPIIKATLLNRINQARQQLQSQLPSSSQYLSAPLVQANLRIIPSAFAYAIGFAAAARRRGQKISLLDEIGALNQQNAQARLERRRSRQAFLQGVQDARMEQAMLAEEHQPTVPDQEPDLSDQQPGSAQGPAPMQPQERAGRQRGPVDLAYFEELSRLDEPTSPADASDETPN